MASFQDGFSLLEILVAFAILSISLGVIFQIYSTSLVGASRSDLSSKAAIIATTQMARVGTEIDVEEGEYSGESEEGFRWVIRLTSFPLNDFELSGIEVFNVKVEVTRRNDERFSYAISTLKMADL